MRSIFPRLALLSALTVCLCAAPVAPVALAASAASAPQNAPASQNAWNVITDAFIAQYNARIITEMPPDGTPIHAVPSDEENAVALEDEAGLMAFTLRFDGDGLSGITVESPILDFPMWVAPRLVEAVAALAGLNERDAEVMFDEGTAVIGEASNCSMAFESETLTFGGVTLKSAMLPDPGILRIDFGFIPSLIQP